MPKIIQFELISQYHNDSIVRNFEVVKTKELIGQKYYCSSLKKDMEAYVKGYYAYLALKAIRY